METVPQADQVSEQEVTPEEHYELLQLGLLESAEKRGLIIDHDTYNRLIAEVEIADLMDTPTAKAYRLNETIENPATGEKVKTELFAMMGGGKLSLDREKFFKHSESKQRYILNHELGHRLDQVMRALNPEDWAALMSIITSMPIEHASAYVAKMNQILPEGANEKESAERLQRLTREAVAELFAQYLSSDGSFAGMLMANRLQFTGSSREHGVWDSYEESAAIMRQLKGLDYSNQEGVDQYFADNPQLKPLFESYQHIDQLLHDQEFKENIVEFVDEKGQLLTEDIDELQGEESWLDYDFMINDMPDTTPPIDSRPQSRGKLPSVEQSNQPSPPGWPHFFLNPLSVFRRPAAS